MSGAHRTTFQNARGIGSPPSVPQLVTLERAIEEAGAVETALAGKGLREYWVFTVR